MPAYSVAVERVILTGTLKYAASYQCHIWRSGAEHSPAGSRCKQHGWAIFQQLTLCDFICTRDLRAHAQSQRHWDFLTAAYVVFFFTFGDFECFIVVTLKHVTSAEPIALVC